MTTLTIPDVAAGDNVMNDRNALGDLVSAAYNNLDGANIQTATVPRTALAAGKAVWSITLTCADVGTLNTATVVTGWLFKVPNFDGAAIPASGLKYVNASIGGTNCNSVASNTLAVRQNTNTTIHTISIASLTSGVPVNAAPASPVAISSGDIIDVLYTKSGSPTYQGMTLVLFFQQNHVAT